MHAQRLRRQERGEDRMKKKGWKGRPAKNGIIAHKSWKRIEIGDMRRQLLIYEDKLKRLRTQYLNLDVKKIALEEKLRGGRGQ